MTGFAVVLVLVLIPLSALTIATRRQPVTVGSVSIKRKGRAMTQIKDERPAMITREEHDRVVEVIMRNSGNTIDEMSYQRNKDVQHITALNAEVVRLQKMLDINDPSLEKVTIHRKEYERLTDCKSMLNEIRQIINE